MAKKREGEWTKERKMMVVAAVAVLFSFYLKGWWWLTKKLPFLELEWIGGAVYGLSEVPVLKNSLRRTIFS